MMDHTPPNITLVIDGMMCQQSCGATVSNALQSVKGVSQVLVRFINSDALIWGCDLNEQDLIDAVESVGFGAQKAVLEMFKIESSDGADITSPAGKRNGSRPPHDHGIQIISTNQSFKKSRLEDALQAIDGIMDYEIDVKLKYVYIWGFADSDAILAAIKACGCIAEFMNENENEYFTSQSSTIATAEVQQDNLIVVSLKVSGMSCASCVRNIERQLGKIQGVSNVKVALLAEKCDFFLNPLTTSLDDIVDAISGLGYRCSVLETRVQGQGQKKMYSFAITGMSCANCALKIERSLRKMVGVVSAEVSCMTDRAQVQLDLDTASCAGPRDVIEVVKSLGYGCEIIEDSAKNHSDADSSNSDLLTWKRLLIIAILLGVPVTLLHLGMVHSHMIHSVMETPLLCQHGISCGQTLNLLLNIPMQFGVGYKYYRSAYLGLINGSVGMDFLVVTGTTITFIYSIVQLCFACVNHVPTKHVFLEASGMLLLFVTIGKFMEAYSKRRTATAISNLLTMQVRQALLVVSGGPGSDISETSEVISEIQLELVQKGDLLKVLPGSRIPTDGIIESGTTYVDESMITGESVPVARSVGDHVFGSTVNQNHLIYVRVTSLESESALAQIVKLVEAAQMNKAPVQAYADYIAGIFTPIVLSIALVTFLVWLTLSLTHVVPRAWFEDEYGDPVLFSMLFGISVVVISCPCALGLATPTAIMAGTSVAATNGMLIKGGSAFEMAHKVNTILFDKTGTLTEGRPQVTDEILCDQVDSSDTSAAITPDRLIQLAATVEQSSEHPLGLAILNEAKRRGLELPRVTDYVSLPGYGVKCSTSEGHIILGNRLMMESNKVTLYSAVDSSMWDLEVQGKTVVCVAFNGKIVGIIGIADKIKKESKDTVQALQKMGINTIIVTGDNRTTAMSISEQLGIPQDCLFAGLMPADKVAKVDELKAKGCIVAMVGDGINDSPALAKADIGIAIGCGTQVAVEAANMVLIRNNLHDVVVALDLSKVVFNRIKINFVWAIIYNIIAIPFAAGVWFPWTKILVPPQYAGLSMALSSISVVLSSSTLAWYKRPALISTDSVNSKNNPVSSRIFLSSATKSIANIKQKLSSSVLGNIKSSSGGTYSLLPSAEDDGIGGDDVNSLGLELGLGGINGLKHEVDEYMVDISNSVV